MAQSLGGLGLQAVGAARRAVTGLTGMRVSRDPHHALTVLYGKTLRTLNKMPESYAYRRHTETIINERLRAVEAEKDIGKLERKINSGLIEEVIIQAEYELLLSRKLLDSKSWESLVEAPPHNQWKWPI